MYGMKKERCAEKKKAKILSTNFIKLDLKNSIKGRSIVPQILSILIFPYLLNKEREYHCMFLQFEKEDVLSY